MCDLQNGGAAVDRQKPENSEGGGGGGLPWTMRILRVRCDWSLGAFVHSARTARTARTLQGEIGYFCYHGQYSCLCGPYHTPIMLHNLMFQPNLRSRAESIQMSRMTLDGQIGRTTVLRSFF